MSEKKILLAAPRGYCAGVDRAVETVEKALEKYGAPVYVRKEIVHNKYVVETFEDQGVIFVDETDEVPEGSHLVFSAHGVSPAVHEEAAALNLQTLDATCPLVTKVHNEVKRFVRDGYQILFIGHEGHEEVEGTMGEAPDHTHLVDGVAGVDTLPDFPADQPLIWLSQTTLSVDETLEIVAALKRRFPDLQDPPSDDICYALLDLEDGLEMGILRFDEVAEILIQIAGGAPDDYAAMQRHRVSQRRRIAALRGAAMERAVNDVGAVFVQHEAELLNGQLRQDLLELCHPDLDWGVKAAKQLARERIFQNERKAKLEIGAYTTLGILLEAFIGAAHELHHTGGSTFKHQRVLALIGENTPRPSWRLYDSYRRMLDFIGGMTDHYAVDLAQEMGGRLRGD